jgi:hypothetical protein
MKLKAALLGCTFLAATAAAQEQLYFGAEDQCVTEHAQPSLNSDFQLACESIAKSISPASQVFFPGGFSSLLGPSSILNLKSFLVRYAGIQGGYVPLVQLEQSNCNVLRASWKSRGPRLDCE